MVKSRRERGEKAFCRRHMDAWHPAPKKDCEYGLHQDKEEKTMIRDCKQPLYNLNMPPRKTLVKKGTIEIDGCETNMVEWKGRLLRFKWMRPDYMRAITRGHGDGYFCFTDMETDEDTPAFAHGFQFGSAYVEEVDGVETAYVYGTLDNLSLYLFRSTDLETWYRQKIVDFPKGWPYWNSSVCKGPDGYVMAAEVIGPTKDIEPVDEYGMHQCLFFLKSDDLVNWTFMDIDKHCFTRERYSACPVIRYCEDDGFYYIIYLGQLPYWCYQPYIVRTKDFEEWEMGTVNPVFMSSEEDKLIGIPGKFTEEEKEHIRFAHNINNSDVDVCEFKGKTYILYSWGNQLGIEFVAQAEYDGSMNEFLMSFYPCTDEEKMRKLKAEDRKNREG